MNKAERALTLLGDEFFTGEIDALRQSYVDNILNSKPDDYDIREDSYRKVKVLDDILAHFEAIAAEKQMISKRWKIL